MKYISKLKQKHWVGNSYRKPYYKQTPTRQYRRRIRRVQKQYIDDIIKLVDNSNYEIPDKREIVNDYDVIDYRYIRFPKLGSYYLLDEPKKAYTHKKLKLSRSIIKFREVHLDVCK